MKNFKVTQDIQKDTEQQTTKISKNQKNSVRAKQHAQKVNAPKIKNYGIQPSQIYFSSSSKYVKKAGVRLSYISVPTFQQWECWRVLEMARPEHLTDFLKQWPVSAIYDYMELQDNVQVKENIYGKLLAYVRSTDQKVQFVKPDEKYRWQIDKDDLRVKGNYEAFRLKFKEKTGKTLSISEDMIKQINGQQLEKTDFLITGTRNMHVYIAHDYFYECLSNSGNHPKLNTIDIDYIIRQEQAAKDLIANIAFNFESGIQHDVKQDNQIQEADQHQGLYQDMVIDQIKPTSQIVQVQDQNILDNKSLNLNIVQQEQIKCKNVKFKDSFIGTTMDVYITNILKQNIVRDLSTDRTNTYKGFLANRKEEQIQYWNITPWTYDFKIGGDIDKIKASGIQYLEKLDLLVADNYINSHRTHYFTVFGTLYQLNNFWYIDGRQVQVQKIKYSHQINSLDLVRIGYSVYQQSYNPLGFQTISPQPIKTQTTIENNVQDRIIGCPNYLYQDVHRLLSAVSNPASNKNISIYLDKLVYQFRLRNIPLHQQDPHSELIELTQLTYIYVNSQLQQNCRSGLEVDKSHQRTTYDYWTLGLINLTSLYKDRQLFRKILVASLTYVFLKELSIWWRKKNQTMIDYTTYISQNYQYRWVIIGAGAIVQGHQDYTQFLDTYNQYVIQGIDVQKLKESNLDCGCSNTQIRRPIEGTYTATTEVIHTYTCCKYNAISALMGRHGGGKLQPEEPVVEDFGRFVRQDQDVKSLIEYMDAAPILDCNEYLDYVKQHDIKKYKQYKDSFYNLQRAKTSMVWDCFPKTNEYKIIPSDVQLTKPPRCIYSPPDHILVGGGTINHYLTRYIKNQSWSGIALTPKELNDRIQDQIQSLDDPVVLGLDTSNFDRCQHYSILRCVDHYLLRKTRIIEKLLLPYNIVERLVADLTTGIIKAQMRLSKLMLITFKVVGTVYSGNSFTSTFNTLRNYLYVKYALRHVRVPYHIICTGDDTLVLCNRRDSALINQTLRVFYSEQDIGTHNLGQQVKEIIQYETVAFKYLSKDFTSDQMFTQHFREYLRVTEIQQASRSYEQDHVIVQSTANNLATMLPLPYIKLLLDKYPKPQQFTKKDLIIEGKDWYQSLMLLEHLKYSENDVQKFELMHYVKGSGYFMHVKQLNNEPSNLTQTGDPNQAQYNQEFSSIIYLNSLSSGLHPLLLYTQAPKNINISAKHYVTNASSLEGNKFVSTQLTQEQAGTLSNINSSAFKPYKNTQVIVGMLSQQKSLKRRLPQKGQTGKYSQGQKIKQARQEYLKQHPKATVQQICDHLSKQFAFFDQSKLYPNQSKRQEISCTSNKSTVPMQLLSNGKILIGLQIDFLEKFEQDLDIEQLFYQLTPANQSVYETAVRVLTTCTDDFKQVMPESNFTEGWRQARIQILHKLIQDQNNNIVDNQLKQLEMTTIGMESLGKIKNRNKKAKYQAQLMGVKQTSKKPATAYVESVLNPFNTMSVRAPNDFYQPTSLLDFKFEADWSPGTNNATLLLYPQWFMQQSRTNSTSWLNLLNYAAGSTTAYATGTVNSPNQCIAHPLAGGINVQNSPTNYYSMDPTNTTNGRWTSARTIRCGIRIIPSANITVKQGTITYGCIPGKTFNVTNLGSVSIPTVNQLRQYPTSYESQLAGVGQEGIKYIWLPLDPMDQIFSSGNLSATNVASGEVDAELTTYCTRSPIYALLTGISTSDTFRVEVVTTVEYVPTLTFESWSPSKTSDLSSDVSKSLSKFFGNNIFEAITGKLGDMIVGDPYSTGQLISKLIPYIGHLM